MKKSFILFVILNCLLVKFSYSQIIAGSGYPGLIISNPNVNLSVSTIGSSVYGLIDVDCDSIADIQVHLYKGPTMIDGANAAFLYILNPSFEICEDTGSISNPVHLFSLGDSVVCPSVSTWSNDTAFLLGNFGCMDCSGPSNVNNLFIAYRNTSTSQIGWIKISFNLFDSGGPSPITLSIPEVLSPCISTVCAIPMGGSGTDTCGIFSYNYTINPPSCNGSCNGSIAITGLSGGTPPYIYSWNDPANQTTANATGLCSGVYTLSWTDGSGSSCTAVFNLPDGPTLYYTLNVTNVSCFNLCDGVVCATGFGTTSPYSYSWEGGAFVASGCFSSACAGTYNFCVKDGNGCLSCDTAVVNEPLPIQATEIVTNESCFGCCDGAIQISPSGGTGGYVYNWTPGSPIGDGTPMISGLCSSTYTYCITDMNGCELCDTATVSFPLGIINSELESDYSISPNPANSFIDIETKGILDFKNCSVCVYDHRGKLILKELIFQNEIRINTDHFSNGIYFIRLQIDDKTISKKFIKE